MTDHTPTPYYATPLCDDILIQSAAINEDNYVGKCDMPADADFIVTACNNHDKMVAALEACITLNPNDKDQRRQAVRRMLAINEIVGAALAAVKASR